MTGWCLRAINISRCFVSSLVMLSQAFTADTFSSCFLIGSSADGMQLNLIKIKWSTRPPLETLKSSLVALAVQYQSKVGTHLSIPEKVASMRKFWLVLYVEDGCPAEWWNVLQWVLMHLTECDTQNAPIFLCIHPVACSSDIINKCRCASSTGSHTCSNHNRSTTIVNRCAAMLWLLKCSFFFSLYFPLSIILIKLIYISSVHRTLLQNSTASLQPAFLFLRHTRGFYLVVMWFSWSFTRKHVHLHPGEHSWFFVQSWKAFSSPCK